MRESRVSSIFWGETCGEISLNVALGWSELDASVFTAQVVIIIPSHTFAENYATIYLRI